MVNESIKIGDRVRYIHVDNEDDVASGYYPPVGTLGTVTVIDDGGPTVKWDSGTKGDGEWYCDFEDVEKVDVPRPITGEKAIEILKSLQESARYIDLHEDDTIEDYRNMAGYEIKEMVETLLKLEL